MAVKQEVKPVIAQFDFERATKNKVRFSEVGSEHIGTLYLSQEDYTALGEPQVLTVTVTAA